MGFNYRKEEYKLKKHQEAQRKFFKSNGMTDEQIAVIEEMEWDDFRYRRNQESNGTTVPLMVEGDDGFEHEYDPIAMSYEDEHFTDPFVDGFDDPLLQKLWDEGDFKDRKIMLYLSLGLNQTEIAERTDIPQRTISHRIEKWKKKFS